MSKKSLLKKYIRIDLRTHSHRQRTQSHHAGQPASEDTGMGGNEYTHEIMPVTQDYVGTMCCVLLKQHRQLNRDLCKFDHLHKTITSVT